MKQSFKEVGDLASFLQANIDKKYKIKTKFSYKKDEIIVERYDATEIKKKEPEKKTYNVSRYPYGSYGCFHYEIEELPDPMPHSSYIVNFVKPCNSEGGGRRCFRCSRG